MPRGKKFEAGKLGETLEALDSVARKPKESINLKELIKGLKPKIKRLRIWDYNWSEIVELLGQQGIDISEDTLKEYMKTPRRKKDKPTKKETFPAASTDKLNEDDINTLNDGNTSLLNEANTVTLNQVDANTLNEVDGKPSEYDDELTKDTKSEPKANGYQPIKLTMRK